MIMMKRLLLFVILTFSFISSIFCLSPFFEVVTHQPLTPFYFLKISLENVPEDVYFIKASITISDDMEKKELAKSDIRPLTNWGYTT